MKKLSRKEIEAMLDRTSELFDYLLTQPGDASDRRASLVNQLSIVIRQLLKEREWRPIETVPKDGTHVDLWLQSYRLADRDKDEMIPSVGFRISDAHWYDEMWCDNNGMPHEDLDGWPDSKITYWRPIPSPPLGQDKTEKE